MPAATFTGNSQWFEGFSSQIDPQLAASFSQGTR